MSDNKVIAINLSLSIILLILRTLSYMFRTNILLEAGKILFLTSQILLGIVSLTSLIIIGFALFILITGDIGYFTKILVLFISYFLSFFIVLFVSTLKGFGYLKPLLINFYIIPYVFILLRGVILVQFTKRKKRLNVILIF